MSRTPSGGEQPAEHAQVLDRLGEVGQDRPHRDDVKPAGGDLGDLVGCAVVGVPAARLPSRGLDRVGRQVDAVALEATLVGDVEEQAVAAPEVQQPPPVPDSNSGPNGAIVTS